MATARHPDDRADGPTGWMILLGLMVLALVIAWSAKGCGSDDPNKGLAPTATQTGTSTGTSSSANAGQNVVDQIRDLVTKSGGIQFTTGSADLTTSSKATLDDVAKILGRNGSVNIVIAGHTDTQGESAANKALSQRRADAVRDYLVSKGVATNRMVARGFGEEQPLVANDSTEAARAQNRRVEFSLGN